jgi:N-acetylmuramoyl-L-alanine amidase
MLVSVHTNTYSNPTAAGTETLYNPLPAGSSDNPSRLGISNARLAQIVQDHLIAELGTRDRGIIERDDLYVLNNSAIPAVFAEIDFKTNPQALANLQDPAYQQRIAEALYSAIVYAFNQR